MDMARTMLNESKLNDKFWGQAAHTAVHILNIGLLTRKNDKTPYELSDRKSKKCTTLLNIWKQVLYQKRR